VLLGVCAGATRHQLDPRLYLHDVLDHLAARSAATGPPHLLLDEDSRPDAASRRLSATAGHLFSGGFGGTSFGVGYFARSARHFFASSGLFVAV
jgi:hypothetical protein